MRKYLFATMTLAFGMASASAQSLDELNIQIHGYATQGFLYTTQNNAFTTTSSNGSPAWSEAVVNVGTQPAPKLRFAVQARYFLLGNYGNNISLDWAAADYKADDRFGVRFGKVKTPSGMFNELQDIDPSYMWSLLPQSIYPITSRNSQLSHYGGVVYGKMKLGQKFGKLDYTAFGGERKLGGDDGYFFNQTEGGIVLPNGVSAVMYGGSLHWETPLPGLMAGVSYLRQNESFAPIAIGSIHLTEEISAFNRPSYFVRYEKGKVMVAAEQNRFPLTGYVGSPSSLFRVDDQAFYVMASYKVSSKLSVGAYDSQIFNRAGGKGPANFSKDWVVSSRYDFNQFLYAKAEQHFVNGTLENYDTTLNPPTKALPTGLNPSTKMTILKIGVSF